MGKKGVNYWEKKFISSLQESNTVAAAIMKRHNKHQEKEREAAPEWVLELFNEYPEAYGVGEIRENEYVLVLRNKVGRTGNKSEVMRLKDGNAIGNSEEVPLVDIKYLRKHYVVEEVEELKEELEFEE